MQVLKEISSYAESKKVQFILIGGHAVSIRGYQRYTGDIDLLIPSSQKDLWSKIFEALRYKSFQNDARFARYEHQDLSGWPIDIMIVDDQTFETFLSEATVINFNDYKCKVISAKHLIFLKLHALKHYIEHRYAKDITDLIELLRVNLNVLSENEFKVACEKYATIDIYNKITKDFNFKF